MNAAPYRAIRATSIALGCCVLGIVDASHAAVPVANGQIAFVQGGNITVVNPDGRGKRRLTSTGDTSGPSWSPDASRLAFYRLNKGIYTIRVGGSGEKNLTTGLALSPAWSPDGMRIAYTCAGQSVGVCVMRADGSGSMRLTPAGTNSNTPVWSPDGRRIAYACAFNVRDDLCVMNSDGGGSVNVTNTSLDIRETPLDWSPDGSTILFARTRFAAGGGGVLGNELLTMRTDGSAQTPLPIDARSIRRASWAPDGRRLVLEVGGSIEVVNADGRDRTKIAEGRDPSWGVSLATVQTVRFAGPWRESVFRGGISVTGRAGSATRLQLVLTPRSGRGQRPVTMTIPVHAGRFQATARTPQALLPGSYALRVLDLSSSAELVRRTLRLAAPPEGVVTRAFISAMRTGPPATALPGRRTALWAHFVFAVQPKPGMRLQVTWYPPPGAGRPRSVGKPNAPTVVSVVSSGAGLASGVWRAALTAGRKTVKQVSVRIDD